MKNSSNRSANGDLALPRNYIVSPANFELETEHIFNRHWQYVCRTSEIMEPSGLYRFELLNNQLFLARGEDGEIRAFRNFCRHRGSELVTSENCQTMGSRIQCPYHAWTYDRCGALLSAPNMMDMDSFSSDQWGLKSVHCEVWHGFVFVHVGEPSESLTEFLAPLEPHAVDWNFESLLVGVEIVYDVQANWKLIFQNYSECYHCPSVHPALNRLTPYKGASNDIAAGPILGGPMMLSDDCQTMSSDGRRVANCLPGLSEEQQRMVAYYTLFPGLFISPHPDYVLLHRLERKTVEQTQVVCQLLFHPEAMAEPEFDPAAAVEFWDLTNRQDWRVCELAQRGIKDAGYEPGPYADLESVVAAFDRYYREQMDTAC
ncbi:MAG: aromatic ring-hydroxylating dioxygenase subunit alpha [Mariniblastus sp.]|nr:aromatic ring-hydroxylating dioxygenase subunit alpha [Mariniblastus sp.]